MKWLSVDPGEYTGWALWEDKKLKAAGTTPLWHFADEVWTEVKDAGPSIFTDSNYYIEDDPVTAYGPLDLLVVEDYKIYPWKAKELIWDSVRTARLIGALTFMARACDIEFELQPAAIKEQAVLAGAEELFLRPLHENRHHNDAIMHGVYYILNKLT